MPRDARAVVFDLDDTLYPLRRFIVSGFAVVARELERRWSVDRAAAFAVLTGASGSKQKGHELQVCAERFGLPPDTAAALVDLIRNHEPAIRLPRTSRSALDKLRGRWRLGVLTNGHPDLQMRKVEALGLRFLVDEIVCAHEIGDRSGKPAREPFAEIAKRLAVSPERTVFVGDDLQCDMLGAARAGMRTIHFTGFQTKPPRQPIAGVDATVRSLAAVPELAARLVAERWRSDVA
jgi:putative hydrolase of the HAD superfamily